MARGPSPRVIGAFILGGALLVVAAIVVWGSGSLFDRKYRYVCYFPGSVNGLDAGAPVKYRGVPIGSVVGLRIRYQQRPGDSRIPVFVELSNRRVRELGAGSAPGPQLMSKLIAQGLRARLESQSMVTGQLFVNLDFFPDTQVALAQTGQGYPEIPTIPTTLEEATRSLSALLEQIRKADLAGAAHSLSSAIEGINRLVHTPTIGKTLGELPSTIASFRKLSEDVQSSLTARGPIVVELQRALIDVQKAADSVRTLADFLRRNPNALIVGKKRP